MISREEKNKVIVHKIKKEKTIKISKIILKIFFIILLIVTIFFLYAYFIGVKGLKTREYNINNNTIPKSFHGVKIVHFTDLLYGSTIDNNYLNTLSNELKLLNPNIVVFTGNIIARDYSLKEDDIKNINEFLKKIPYTIGKYAIKGNYDKANFDLIMENTNFTILDNETIKAYNHTNEFINIIGININDKKELKLNNDSYTITLINNYDNYHEYNINSNLILAGNNLGGEIRFGSINLSKNKYNQSYYKKGNSLIYISNGLGSTHHLRFMNHPSINVYRLIAK